MKKRTSHDTYELIRYHLQFRIENPTKYHSDLTVDELVRDITLVNNEFTDFEEIEEKEVLEVFESSRTLREMYMFARAKYFTAL